MWTKHGKTTFHGARAEPTPKVHSSKQDSFLKSIKNKEREKNAFFFLEMGGAAAGGAVGGQDTD